MEESGVFANEIPAIAGETITYTYWRSIKRAGIKKADRPALIQQAVNNEWTPKELTEHIRFTQASYLGTGTK